MKLLSHKRIRQSGETIVEVLIAIAVLSSALGIAFATASRSGKGLQANRERYQAQLLANEQASLLKANAASTDIRINDNFCFNTGYAVIANTTATNLNAACADRGVSGLYDVNISDITDPTCTDGSIFCTFIIHVEWDNLSGTRDNVEVFYAI